MAGLEGIRDHARTIFEGEIDYKGQYLSETLSTALLVLSGTLAFLAGYVTENIRNTLYVGLGGTVLTFLVVVPPWPFFNRDPLVFLPPKTGPGALQGVSVNVNKSVD